MSDFKRDSFNPDYIQHLELEAVRTGSVVIHTPIIQRPESILPKRKITVKYIPIDFIVAYSAGDFLK